MWLVKLAITGNVHCLRVRITKLFVQVFHRFQKFFLSTLNEFYLLYFPIKYFYRLFFTKKKEIKLVSDICTVPKTTKSYYETETSLLSPSDRVISGTKIFFQCIDQGKHKLVLNLKQKINFVFLNLLLQIYIYAD